MASPLSPLSATALNTKLPSSRDQSFVDAPEIPAKFQPCTTYDEDEIIWDEEPSSPFVTELQSDIGVQGLRTASGDLQRPRLTEGLPCLEEEIEATPFKIAEDDSKTESVHATQAQGSFDATPTTKSSAFTNQLPSKSARSTRSFRPDGDTFTRKTGAPFMTAKENFAKEETEVGDITTMTFNEDPTIDDTCFSTFSEVPNADMTAFARLGQRSPTKQFMFDQQTPRAAGRHTPGTARTTRQMPSSPRSPSPTPRQSRAPAQASDNDTTNLLLDFTQQFEAFASQNTPSQHSRSPARRSPSKGAQLLSYIQSQRSPAKSGAAFSTPLNSKRTLLNLLDIELPPAPTPRSVPSITIREMESLKSELTSEISSLKATLSGRQAEVEALKRAVGDAERRVGEAAETAREEKSKREHIEKEKEEWERRGREFEDILKKVRKEVIEAEKERADTEGRLADAEERVKEAETRAEEAEARAVQAATKIVPSAATVGPNDDHSGPLFTAEQVQAQIDEKVHALSTELHAIYKKKHITKVAGLKKGFEAKTKEKTADLQTRIDELERRNDDLQAKIDGTISGVHVLPTLDNAQRESELKKLEEQSALIERQKAELLGKDSELRTAQKEFSLMMKELEQERIEKSELVAAVDEMLALQADMSVLNAGDNSSSSAVDTFRTSVGLGSSIAAPRPTGLARPGFGALAGAAPSQSKIGQPAGLTRSGSAGKSRMMSNIERMGGRALQ